MTPTDSTIVEEQIQPNADPEDWIYPESGDDRYSSNQVVVAYKVGVTTGIENAFEVGQEWVKRTREQNASKAAVHTRTVLDWLIGKGINPISAILNQTQFDAPEVLILLPLEEYSGSLFEGVYGSVGVLEQEWREPNYSISFSFTYYTEGLNFDLLSADGFTRYHKFLLKNE